MMSLKEKRGMLVLLFLLLVFCIAIFIRYKSKPENIEIEIVGTQAKANLATEKYSLQKFDPNELDSIGFLALGFTARQSLTILNYRNSLGGHFPDKAKFKTCYAISEDKWAEIESYIDIKTIEDKKAPIIKTVFEIDLNNIDYEQLRHHKLIDNDLARKLFAARIRYGGFICFEQMDEIFRSSKDELKELKPFFYFDHKVLVKYNVNQDNAPLLAEHPYMRLSFTEAIVKLRQEKGSIKSFGELKNLKYFPKSKSRWLEHYLEF